MFHNVLPFITNTPVTTVYERTEAIVFLAVYGKVAEIQKEASIYFTLCEAGRLLSIPPATRPPVSVVLRFRLRFTSAFV
jgi:hypothetical protein